MLGFQGKVSRLLFFFFFFFSFSFCFFFSFLEDNIGLHIWVTQTYHGLPTCLRPALQGEKRYIISQPIGTIWCAVCELAKGGMFTVENVKTSIDQKLTHAWNCSNIKVTCRVSLFQLKAINCPIKSNSIVQLKTKVDTQSGGTKVICKSVINCK